MGCPSAFLSESERRGQGSLGPVLDVESGSSLTVGSLERLGSGWAGPPPLRLLVFHAMVVPTLGLCVDRTSPLPLPLIHSGPGRLSHAGADKQWG